MGHSTLVSVMKHRPFQISSENLLWKAKEIDVNARDVHLHSSSFVTIIRSK